MGAHLVVHSATKFLSGHGVVIGGRAGRRRALRLAGLGQFPTLTEPYEGFHGMVFAEESHGRRSCCARAAKGCAISARAWRR
jgi:O-acetylhomoserine (thiol)-lyase